MRSHEEGPTEDEGPSKTQVKQSLHDLQDLGAALMELPEAQLDCIEMEERLRDALHELRRMSAHSARKRQTQYVGKLLRDIDLEPFHRALAARRAGKAKDARAHKEVERWRERLLTEPDGLTAWAAACPAGDTPQFRALVRRARHEWATSTTKNGRAYRELFQNLRSLLPGS